MLGGDSPGRRSWPPGHKQVLSPALSWKAQGEGPLKSGAPYVEPCPPVFIPGCSHLKDGTSLGPACLPSSIHPGAASQHPNAGLLHTAHCR